MLVSRISQRLRSCHHSVLGLSRLHHAPDAPDDITIRRFALSTTYLLRQPSYHLPSSRYHHTFGIATCFRTSCTRVTTPGVTATAATLHSPCRLRRPRPPNPPLCCRHPVLPTRTPSPSRSNPSCHRLAQAPRSWTTSPSLPPPLPPLLSTAPTRTPSALSLPGPPARFCLRLRALQRVARPGARRAATLAMRTSWILRSWSFVATCVS